MNLVMKKWTPFTPEEVKALTSNAKSPEDKTERQCPCCGNKSVRYYYQEYKSDLPRGNSRFWCYKCRKYVHFSTEPLSKKFEFNNPLEKFYRQEFSYDDLDAFWDKGLLPQTFKKNK